MQESTVTAPHCLLVTHVGLNQLAEKNSGTYRRLFVVLDAIEAVGIPCKVFCTIAPEEVTEPLPVIAAQIERELQEMRQFKARVTVSVRGAPEDTPWLVQQVRGISGYSRHPIIRSLFPAAALTLLARAVDEKPAFIVAHRLPAMSVLNRVARTLPPTFFDLDDIEHIVTLRGLARAKSLRSKLFDALWVPALLWAERKAIHSAHRTFVCSGEDVTKARKLFRDETVEMLPNSVGIPAIEVAIAPSPVLLMVGIYSYGPNADGADFFIREVFPLIRARMPDVELWLAGKSPESVPSFHKSPDGVNFLGFVDDLDAVYRQARVVICPIRYGGGTRVKLVEAAAWGKPIVSTPLGAEGLGLVHGHDLLLADDPARFAESCERLLRDDALCGDLARNARETATRTFDRAPIVEQLAAKFREFAAPAGRPVRELSPSARG